MTIRKTWRATGLVTALVAAAIAADLLAADPAKQPAPATTTKPAVKPVAKDQPGPQRVETRKPVNVPSPVPNVAPIPPTSAIVVENCWVQFQDYVTLASDRGGVVAYIEPGEGGTVTAKQHVAGLDDRIARAAFETAELEAKSDVDVRYAKKAAEVAIAEYRIAVDANQRVAGAVPIAQVSRLRLAAERAVLQVEQSEHAYQVAVHKRDEAAAVLQTHRLAAPFDGVVLKVFKQPGEAARQGDPIVQLGGTSRLRVEGFVNAALAWTVRPGATVEVQLDLDDVDLPVEKEVFHGKIKFVDFAVQPLTRQVRLWAEVANRADLLRPA